MLRAETYNSWEAYVTCLVLSEVTQHYGSQDLKMTQRPRVLLADVPYCRLPLLDQAVQFHVIYLLEVDGYPLMNGSGVRAAPRHLNIWAEQTHS